MINPNQPKTIRNIALASAVAISGTVLAENLVNDSPVHPSDHQAPLTELDAFAHINPMNDLPDGMHTRVYAYISKDRNSRVTKVSLSVDRKEVPAGVHFSKTRVENVTTTEEEVSAVLYGPKKLDEPAGEFDIHLNATVKNANASADIVQSNPVRYTPQPLPPQ